MIIHTGSRNFGKQVAEIYQQLTVDLNQGKETYFEQRDTIIREYKAAGRRKEIQNALKAIVWKPRENSGGFIGKDRFERHRCFSYNS